MFRIFALIALVTCSGVAFAQSGPPRYDPPAYCESVADTVGGSARIKNRCIEQEQAAYDALKAMWSVAPPSAASYCDQVAQAIGGSYRILERCIQQETSASETAPDFKF